MPSPGVEAWYNTAVKACTGANNVRTRKPPKPAIACDTDPGNVPRDATMADVQPRFVRPVMGVVTRDPLIPPMILILPPLCLPPLGGLTPTVEGGIRVRATKSFECLRRARGG